MHQKPSKNSKSKDHITHLKKRLDLGQKGDIQSSLRKGDVFRNSARNKSLRPSDDDAIARNVSRVMLQGKVQNALRYCNSSGGVLTLNRKQLRMVEKNIFAILGTFSLTNTP